MSVGSFCIFQTGKDGFGQTAYWTRIYQSICLQPVG
ncbi:hypothetical protein D9758_016616 [Tetrapyrgos nigripes]|uniref:Uncharacterized protein n=1 Tax=Tetrapyrgos nigripes TaxID=182062 RepID=A0A8H5CAN3_9AGAR|nr:hypothetical protein D9758_016616 [Tetrapyrgos nigripes]